MNAVLRNALAVAGLAFAAQAAADVTFYEHEGFEGRTFSTGEPVGNFERLGFNDRASSIVIVGATGGKSAKTRTSAGGASSCVRAAIRRLAAMGMNDRDFIGAGGEQRTRTSRGSLRAPPPVAVYDYHRRDNETAVRGQRHVGPCGGRDPRAALLGRARAGGCRIAADSTFPARLSAPSSAAFSVTRSAADAATISPPSAAQSPAPRWAPTSVAAAANRHTQDVQRCARRPARRGPTIGMSPTTSAGQEHRMQMTAPSRTHGDRQRAGEPRA